MTPDGKARAEAELAELRDVRRPSIVAAIKTAREFGDLSENAEYHAAREEQGLNEARIRTLEHYLARAVVEESDGGGETVGVGSTVSFRDSGSGETKSVTLVHPLEASAPEGRISFESPIAKGLTGARKGETVTIELARGQKRLEILKIS